MAPPRTAARSERLAVYAAWRPTTLHDTIYHRPDGTVTQRTTDRLTLANGTNIQHPEDLIPLTGDPSPYAESARVASSLDTRFRALLGSGVGLILAGGGVLLASRLRDGPVFGDDGPVTLGVSIGAIVTGIAVGLVGGLAYSEPSRLARLDAFERFDGALQARLGLCGVSLMDCDSREGAAVAQAAPPAPRGPLARVVVRLDARGVRVDDPQGGSPPPQVVSYAERSWTDSAAATRVHPALVERLRATPGCAAARGAEPPGRRLDLIVDPSAPTDAFDRVLRSLAAGCEGPVQASGRLRDQLVSFELPSAREPGGLGVRVDLGPRGYVVSVDGRFVQPGCHGLGGATVTIPRGADGAPDLVALRSCVDAIRSDEGVREWLGAHPYVAIRATAEQTVESLLSAAQALTRRGATGDGVAAGPVGLSDDPFARVARGEVVAQGGPTFPLSPPGIDDPARAALREAFQRAVACAAPGQTVRVDASVDPTTGRVRWTQPPAGPADAVACVSRHLDAVALPAPRLTRTDFVWALGAARPAGAPAPSVATGASAPSDRASVMGALIRERMGAIHACYARPRGAETVSATRVMAYVTVDEAGAVPDLTVQSQAPFEALGPCLTRALGSIRNDARAHSVEPYAFPLVFEPGADAEGP